MNTPKHSRLGKPTGYADQYDASLLFPIARAPQRAELGLGASLPFMGADLWTAFELSWLNPRGKPQVALAHITVPCESVNLIESKSLKLYLGSFNNTRLTDAAEVLARLRADLTEAAWRGAVVQSSVGVKLVAAEWFDREPIEELDGLSLDRLDLDCDRYSPAPELLSAATNEAPVSEVLTSNLLRSNCPVTGQPDWGSVQISYFGPQIDQAGLLRYLISFRNHNGFHEDCVERMFMDLQARCQPHRLSVYARYTRRGGLDINPFRTSYPQALPANRRTARQ
ncbi:MAG: NADPH-dependent 7-cyano-7-deazaguanine reductase QueF [Rhodoferax sp.]|uniref:NADPH-dependent 7-cyano-7-deazaguanine reductase QueF n=1 Tax=Rhodoferax sp. TaxID=50421 RepID=UPI003C77970E